MSSDEDITTPTHTDVREQHTRQRRTPKHLEDYIFAYNPHRPAFSFRLDNGEDEETSSW